LQKLIDNYFNENEETEIECSNCDSSLFLKNFIRNFPNYIVLRIERNSFDKFPGIYKKYKTEKAQPFNVMLTENLDIYDVKYNIFAISTESNAHAYAYFSYLIKIFYILNIN